MIELSIPSAGKCNCKPRHHVDCPLYEWDIPEKSVPGVGNPPGWKLVPVEATTPMLRALGDLRAKGQWQWKNQEAWAAMLAAAPPPGRWRHDLDCAQRGGNECSCGLDAEKSGNSQGNAVRMPRNTPGACVHGAGLAVHCPECDADGPYQREIRKIAGEFLVESSKS